MCFIDFRLFIATGFCVQIILFKSIDKKVIQIMFILLIPKCVQYKFEKNKQIN